MQYYAGISVVIAILVQLVSGQEIKSNADAQQSINDEYYLISGKVLQVLSDGLLVSGVLRSKAELEQIEIFRKEIKRLNEEASTLRSLDEVLKKTIALKAKINAVLDKPPKTYKIQCDVRGYADDDIFKSKRCKFVGTYQYVNPQGVKNTIRQFRVITDVTNSISAPIEKKENSN
jgi:hypothetical protein